MNLIPLFIILFASTLLNAQTLIQPTGYELVDSISGDLNLDGKPELVVLWNTKVDTSNTENIPREIIIYQFTKNEWIEWKKSSKAALNSRDAGMMIDPYDGMMIENGILTFDHWGGSSWKWRWSDQYKFIDEEFILISSYHNNGRLCDYFETIEINFVTGILTYQKEVESCEEEIETSENKEVSQNNTLQVIKETIKIAPYNLTFQNRFQQEINIILPNKKEQVSIAWEIEN